MDMGGIKKVYMEIYDKFDGEIPEGYTLGDYVAEINENKRLHEYELLKQEEESKKKIES
jgi:hypothetical protein